MILVDTLHLDFTQQANHTASEKLAELSKAQIDYYLNKAKNLFYEMLAGKVETNDLARQYLKPLIVRDKKLEGTSGQEKFVTKYPKDFYKPLKVFAKAKRGNCPERRLIVRRPVSDKIERGLKNPNINRFWDFEETFAIESSNGLEIYQGDMTFTGVYLDYLKILPDVAGPELENAEEYITANGEAITTNINLEVEDKGFAHKIVSLAVLLAQRDYGHIQDFEMKMATITNIERI